MQDYQVVGLMAAALQASDRGMYMKQEEAVLKARELLRIARDRQEAHAAAARQQPLVLRHGRPVTEAQP